MRAVRSRSRCTTRNSSSDRTRSDCSRQTRSGSRSATLLGRIATPALALQAAKCTRAEFGSERNRSSTCMFGEPRTAAQVRVGLRPGNDGKPRRIETAGTETMCLAVIPGGIETVWPNAGRTHHDVARARPHATQRDVGLAARQADHVHTGDDFQEYPGVEPLEPAQTGSDHVGCDIVRRRDTDFARCAQVAAECLTLRRGDGVLHVLRLHLNELTAFGERIAILPSIKQPGPELLLQRGDSTANRRRAALQRPRGDRKAPAPRDSQKMPEIIPVHVFQKCWLFKNEKQPCDIRSGWPSSQGLVFALGGPDFPSTNIRTAHPI